MFRPVKWKFAIRCLTMTQQLRRQILNRKTKNRKETKTEEKEIKYQKKIQ